MKKTRTFILIVILLGIIGFQYYQNKEINKETQNTSNLNEDKKPNTVIATISWIGGSLSTEVTARGDIYYGDESYPINSKEAIKEFISYGFTRGGMLTVGCGNGYIITKCEPFGETDYVDYQNPGCFLGNEDPDLMRTSVIIECHKL